MHGGEYPGVVAAARAETYEPKQVAQALREVLEPFGGASGICSGKKRVLLKPNVLRPALPEEAVTTHPAVVRAAALLGPEKALPVLLAASAEPSEKKAPPPGMMRR